MIPDRIFETIEAPVYGLRMGLVSTVRLFDEALGEEESARTLRDLLKNPENREILVNRLVRLLETEHDAQYAHPYDLAIGVYLRLLEKVDLEMAIEPARKAFALDTLWWGRAFAISILNTAILRTSDAANLLPLESLRSARWAGSSEDLVEVIELPGRMGHGVESAATASKTRSEAA